MSFRAGNVKVNDNDISPVENKTNKVESVSIDLTQQELELLLLTIKNGLFRGEFVENVYTLTLKLQKHLVDLKYENDKLWWFIL